MTTGTIQDHLKRILPEALGKGRLDPAEDREPIPAGFGIGEREVVTASGGIATPISFVSSTTRTETLQEGCCDVDIEVITSVTFRDGNGDVFTLPFE